MTFLKKMAGIIGFLLFLAPCVAAGIWASNLNTSSKLAGWSVGIGVAIIEVALLMLLAEEKARKNLYLTVGVLVVAASPAAYFIGKPLFSLHPFNAHLDEYMAVATAGPEVSNSASGVPIQGKLMPVDMKSKKIDPVFFDLSNDYRPNNAEEIGAIAALWWSEIRIGSYGGKGGAYKEQCIVMVWDKATKTLLAEQEFMGSDPPSSSQNGASQTGSKPYEEIRDYLNHLPHR